MASQLKLYGDIESQGTRAVMTLLAIGKIPHEFVKVDLGSFETRSNNFLELNPFSHIPFLMDGDFKLGESNAILVYLCEKYP
jgi:glutathione S-transferase